MKILKTKTALITSSARGLGKAIAERYAALGANIVNNYSRDKSSADQVVSNIQAIASSRTAFPMLESCPMGRTCRS